MASAASRALTKRTRQRRDRCRVGGPVEAADPDVDRVHGSAADCLHDQVARPFDLEASFHGCPVTLGELDSVGAAEEVGGVKQVDVKGVALDPFSTVEQAPQVSDLFVDG